jgi:hypothetical protein
MSLRGGSISVNNIVVNFYSSLVEALGHPSSRKVSTIKLKAESSDLGLSNMQSWSSPKLDKYDLSCSYEYSKFYKYSLILYNL